MPIHRQIRGISRSTEHPETDGDTAVTIRNDEKRRAYGHERGREDGLRVKRLSGISFVPTRTRGETEGPPRHPASLSSVFGESALGEEQQAWMNKIRQQSQGMPPEQMFMSAIRSGMIAASDAQNDVKPAARLAVSRAPVFAILYGCYPVKQTREYGPCYAESVRGRRP